MKQYKIFITLLILVLFKNSSFASEYFVTSASEINTAMNSAQAGDTLTMMDGVWTNQDINFSGNGVEGDSILLRAETPGYVILNGSSRLSINGSYLKVDGLRFNGGYNLSGAIEFRSGSQHCRVTNTQVSEFNPPSPSTRYHWVVLKGAHHRFDHNYLSGMRHSGVSIIVSLSSEPYGYHRIDHNYLADKPLGNGNGYESIKVAAGAYSDLEGHVTVEHNYLYRCSGEIEIISNKCLYNTYRYNTFVECMGTITMRQGLYCIVEGNYFFGNGIANTGGVRITHRGHKIFNNYFQDLGGAGQRSAITLYTGMPHEDYVVGAGGHVRTDSITLAHNTIVNCASGIYSGYWDNDDTNLLPPKDNILANNIVTMNDAAQIYIADPTHPGINEFWEGNMLNGSNLGDVPDSGYVEDDPELMLTDGWYQISASSPAANMAVGEYPFVVEDIDGIERDLTKDIGADELGSGPRQPLTANDVGPDWLQNPNLPVALQVNTSGSGEIQTDPDGTVFTSGTWVTLTAIPYSGHTFAGWSGDLTSTNNPDSILMDEDKKITARFDPPVKYTLGSWNVGSGSVEMDPKQASYEPGTSVSVMAIPLSGWIFKEWGGSLSGSQNPDTVIMDENKLVIATFLEDPASIRSDNIPLSFDLKQNYPNPFNPVTTISFSLDRSEYANLIIFDMLGNQVAEPVNDYLSAGTYEIHFDASAMASGVYFYKLTSGKNQAKRKMIFMK
jgi:poly(beta-D-mannuronate) lyase